MSESQVRRTGPKDGHLALYRCILGGLRGCCADEFMVAALAS